MKITLLLATILASCCSGALGLSEYTVPDELLLGAGTSAFQVEGAWNEDGKSESLWDHIGHNYPQLISDRKNGDVACDSYHKWQEDIALAKEMGLGFYKFSLSWPRLLPNGTYESDEDINYEAVDYYNNLIDGLEAENIEPMAILFNFDIPMNVENRGGFFNESNIPLFVDYANLAFEKFGDRVKKWVTFNEAHAYCKIIYVDLLARVQNISVGTEPYKCGHNLLLAHARAWHLYDDNYRFEQGGQIGMAFSCYNYIPLTNSSADAAAAIRAREFVWGWFAHPIFVGDYPAVMIEQVAKLSKEEGLNCSRLPAFTEDEIYEIYGTSDYVGINPFFSFLTSDITNQTLPANPQYDIRIANATSPAWDQTSVYRNTPELMRDTINWIWEYTSGEYPIFITEHGLGDRNPGIQDTNRTIFFQNYLDQVLLAIYEDGIDIKLYCVWQMMDTFYFNNGEVLKFGLAHVDFNSTNRTRTLRDSATYYRSVIETRSLKFPENFTTV